MILITMQDGHRKAFRIEDIKELAHTDDPKGTLILVEAIYTADNKWDSYFTEEDILDLMGRIDDIRREK